MERDLFWLEGLNIWIRRNPNVTSTGNPTKMEGLKMSDSTTIKCLLVGDSGVGKSCFAHRIHRGDFPCAPSLFGSEVDTRSFVFEGQPVRFEVADCSGQAKWEDKRPVYYQGAQGAIVMFDVTNRKSYSHVGDWVSEVRQVCGDIPMVLCGNKVDDDKHREVKVGEITVHRELGLPYFEVSAQSLYNIDKPFVTLSQLVG